jgi:hypothetical protein
MNCKICDKKISYSVLYNLVYSKKIEKMIYTCGKCDTKYYIPTKKKRLKNLSKILLIINTIFFYAQFRDGDSRNALILFSTVSMLLIIFEFTYPLFLKVEMYFK